jgi:hypothetical protein
MTPDRRLAAAMAYVATELDDYADGYGEASDIETANQLTQLAADLRTFALRLAPPRKDAV